jgi:hypothetical protein
MQQALNTGQRVWGVDMGTTLSWAGTLSKDWSAVWQQDSRGEGAIPRRSPTCGHQVPTTCQVLSL